MILGVVLSATPVPGVVPVLAEAADPAVSRPVPGAADSSEADRPLLPPLDGPAVLTSSFGEYREGHYHAGLDYSTGGAVGKPVHAPADGWVLRLRASGVGYGRAIYFRLEDGRTAVFGHLDRFAKRIAAAVFAEQDRRRRYEVDFQPPPGSLRFARGEVLGFSGQSGAGPPHLHAELRVGAAAAVAVNPVLRGWSVPDAVPPEIRGFRAEPARAGVAVNGTTDPVFFSAGDTLATNGPFRLWVETVDRAEPGGMRLAPYRVEAAVDEEAVARVELDRVDWNFPREVQWTFEAALARERDQRWVALERPPESRQRITSGPGGTISGLAPGTHRVEVRAEDASGNRSGASFLVRRISDAGVVVRPDPAPRPRPRAVSRRTTLEIRLPEGVRAALRSPDGELRPWPRAGWSPPGTAFHQVDVPDPPRPGWWGILAEGAGLPPGAGAMWIAGEEAARVERPGARFDFPAGSVFGPTWITLNRDSGPAPSCPARPELEPVTPLLRLAPWALPLRERVRVELDPPGGGDRTGLAVYSWSGDLWHFEGADTSGRGVGARLTNLERIALLRDRTPPRVTVLAIAAAARPDIRARVADAGAGVTWRTLTLDLDGEPAIAEWDPEAGVLRVHLRADLAPGSHTVTVTARDRVGNRSVVQSSFTVP